MSNSSSNPDSVTHDSSATQNSSAADAIQTKPPRAYSELLNAIAPAEAHSKLRSQHAELLFARLIGGEQLHAALLPSVQPLLAAMQAQLQQSDDFFTQAQHPIRQLLRCLLDDASHWCPRDFKLNQTYVTKLETLIASASLCWPLAQSEWAPFEQALADFSAWIDTENKRAQMLEERLCNSELAELSLLSAQCRVIETLNQHLAERPLPLELHASIQSLLKSELQHCIVTADASQWQSAPFWKSWQKLLPALGQVFATETHEVDDQLLYSAIPGIISELERNGELTTSNPSAYQQWLAQLNLCLMHAIQKQPQECALFAALPYPEGYSTSNTRITPALLRQSEAIQQGDWLIFSGEDGDKIRCKLALKNPAADQLLFVDRTGRKVLIKSNKDFALCLSGGIVKALVQPQLDHVIHQFLTQLEQKALAADAQRLALTMEKAARAVKVLEAKQKAQSEAAELAKQEAQQHMEQQLDARKAASRKAMAEARALAEQQERNARAQQAAEQERQRLRAQQDAAAANAQLGAAQTAMNDLHVGAWLEILFDDASWVRTKLSVIISSTQKYIFVDTLGRKMAEYQRENLIELLATERARIIHKGDNFEDQLAKVIRGLRKDIS